MYCTDTLGNVFNFTVLFSLYTAHVKVFLPCCLTPAQKMAYCPCRQFITQLAPSVVLRKAKTTEFALTTKGMMY